MDPGTSGSEGAGAAGSPSRAAPACDPWAAADSVTRARWETLPRPGASGHWELLGPGCGETGTPGTAPGHREWRKHGQRHPPGRGWTTAGAGRGGPALGVPAHTRVGRRAVADRLSRQRRRSSPGGRTGHPAGTGQNKGLFRFEL